MTTAFRDEVRIQSRKSVVLTPVLYCIMDHPTMNGGVQCSADPFLGAEHTTQATSARLRDMVGGAHLLLRIPW